MKDCIDIPLPAIKGCPTAYKATLVHYYPASGHVYDLTGNYIGTGTYDGKTLTITPDQHVSPDAVSDHQITPSLNHSMT